MGNYLTATTDGLASYVSPDTIGYILSDLTEPDAAEAIEQAVTAAEEEVDSYLSRRYTVPITGTIPHVIEKVTAALAVLNLHERAASVPQVITDAATRARDWLKNVSKGVASIPGVSPTTVSETSGVAVFAGESRVFDRDSLSFWGGGE